VASWIAETLPNVPESVRLFLALHQKYLASGGDLRRHFDGTQCIDGPPTPRSSGVHLNAILLQHRGLCAGRLSKTQDQ